MSGYSNGDAIRRLLKALSDGRDLITEAYNAGGALPAGFDPDDQKLLSLRLFRVFTGTPDGYLLSPGLGEVIATALREDRSGYIDTAFEKRLQDAEEYAARAARHRKEGRYADADIALKSLKDAVRSIDYGVRHTVERLDLRITNRFGFVTSLDDKIAENQHAIDDTSRLIESLGKFTLAHFDEVSGGDRVVYRILRALSDSIDESRRLLSAVLTRLSMLLMVFRREERETGVLRSFSEWFRKNNGAAVRDLGDDEEIPRLLWIPEALRSGDFLEVVEFSDFNVDSITGDIAGEIRLGYLHQGGKVIPVSGGSVSGSVPELISGFRFSAESRQYNNFLIPAVTRIQGVTVTGAEG